jgi:VIT1/CCC1 family predicted Fe2+/Mn2+ transporter
MNKNIGKFLAIGATVIGAAVGLINDYYWKQELSAEIDEKIKLRLQELSYLEEKTEKSDEL